MELMRHACGIATCGVPTTCGHNLTCCTQMERFEATFNVNLSRVPAVHVRAPFNCTPGGLARLRAKLSHHDVVAAMLYEEVVPNSGHHVRLLRTGVLLLF